MDYITQPHVIPFMPITTWEDLLGNSAWKRHKCNPGSFTFKGLITNPFDLFSTQYSPKRENLKLFETSHS